MVTQRHHLGADREADFDRTACDLVSDLLDGEETRRAEAVGTGDGGGVGEASGKSGDTCLVGGETVVDVATADVFDKGGVDVRAREGVLWGVSSKWV